MKFLLEILGMTNACNLNCDYCDWEKKTKRKLTEKDLKNAEKYLTNIRNVILKKHPEIQLIEYSGGEPFVYPEIVELILRVFSDKWIRIISNGTLINNQQIEMLKKHKNLFIALSCDGNTIEANKPRVHNNEIIFQNILQTIDNLVKNNIPVMILCTLNKANMRLFPEFCYYLKEKYHDSISNGMLVLPAHCVTSYSHDNGSADKDMRVEFKNYLVNLEKDSIISGIFEHYHELANYLLNDTHITKCHVPEWTVSIHFRNDNIVTNGNFISFDCGMRGINEIGMFSAADEESICAFIESIESKDIDATIKETVKANWIKDRGCEYLDKGCNACFVDWKSIDLIINGKINLKQAEKWFILFKDKNIKNFVSDYKFTSKTE